MPMLETPKIRIKDQHQHCVIEIQFGRIWVPREFTRDETVQIERVLHEYNERQKP